MPLTRDEFMSIAHENRKKLWAVAHSKLGDPDEAEDAVSESIIKAADKIHQLQDEDKLLPWLVRIVTNHCYDLHRKRKADKKVNWDKDGLERLMDAEAMTSEERMERLGAMEEILDLMLDIRPEECREVLIYFYYRGFTQSEISDMLGIPLGTVKTRLTKARRLFTNALKERNKTQEDLWFIQDLSQWPMVN